MPHPQHGRVAIDPAETWWMHAAETPDAGMVLATSPLAMSGFVVGWITVGVLVALHLARRGHDLPLALATGAGLGPLMAVVAIDAARWRDPAARPLVLDPGIDHGGSLDILVLVQGPPRDVESVVPTLTAMAGEAGTVLLSRVVDHEWLEGDLDNHVVTAARTDLAAAADLVPVAGAGRTVWPGTVEEAIARFLEPRGRALVLVAVDDEAAERAFRRRP